MEVGFFLDAEALDHFDQLPEEVQRDLPRAVEALGKRFGQASTVEAQKAIFHNMVQGEGETCKEFADRVQLQAREAYPDLPSAYMEKEVLRRYLEGIKDKEAGLNGLVSRFTSLEQAVEHTLLYGESRKALYGARRVSRVCDQESDGEAQVNRV